MNARCVSLIRDDCLRVLDDRAHLLNALKGDSIVITGGTGFVGTWLSETIAALNDEYSFNVKVYLVARGVDHFRASKPHLANRKDFTLVKSDIRYMIELPKEVNWVCHAAAVPDGRNSATNPIESMSVIAEGTSNLLKAADRCAQLKMCLNLSSSLIYGNQPSEVEKISETYVGAPDCSSTAAVYGEAKRYAETLCAAARSQARLPIVTVRPFAFIGPYQSMEANWAINSFIRDALSGSPIRVNGDGRTVRSYLYASDLAFWLLRILTGSESGAVFNVGSDEGINLEFLARIVSENFNPKPEIRLKTAAGVIPNSRMVPDVSAATRVLGLTRSVSLSAAIERTIEWNKSL